MFSKAHIQDAFSAAYPIMLGYMAIGLPCGLLASSIGMNWMQVLLMSLLFYSGAGQFMIPNMYLAGSPIASIVASVSLVNTRQMLYSASLSSHCTQEKKALSFLFAATVTDESFGVNIARFEEGGWSVDRATLVNLLSQSSWTVFNVIGVLVGGVLNVPLAVASFAMTSIFICLMCTQKINCENIVAMVAAMIGVFVCKLVGLGKLAIVLGALLGVCAALACSALLRRRASKDAGSSHAGCDSEGQPAHEQGCDELRDRASMRQQDGHADEQGVKDELADAMLADNAPCAPDACGKGDDAS